MQRVFGISSAGSYPDAFACEGFERNAQADIFLAFAFFALIFGNEPDERAVRAAIVLLWCELDVYVCEFGHGYCFLSCLCLVRVDLLRA